MSASACKGRIRADLGTGGDTGTRVAFNWGDGGKAGDGTTGTTRRERKPSVYSDGKYRAPGCVPCKRCGRPITFGRVEQIFDTLHPEGRRPKNRQERWVILEPTLWLHACVD